MEVSIVEKSGSYLQKAIEKLGEFGISLDTPQVNPIADVISRVSDISEQDAIYLTRVMSAGLAFDKLVTENLRTTFYGQRFETVANAFNEIVVEATEQVKKEQEGSSGVFGSVVGFFKKMTDGDISDRVEEAKKAYNSVISESGNTLDRQLKILEAYSIFRLSQKQGQVSAATLHEQAIKVANEAKAKLAEANNALAVLPAETPESERIKLELARDEMVNLVRAKEAQLLIAERLNNDMKVSYSLSDVVFTRYSQAKDVLDSLHQKMVIFYNTQLPVLAGINASFQGVMAVNEASKTQSAMEDGINRSLEILGTLGNDVLKEGVRVAHAPGIKAASVEKLLTETIQFVDDIKRISAENRKASTEEAEKIRQMVADGEKQLAQKLAVEV